MTTTSIVPPKPVAPPAAESTSGELRFLLYNINWDGYEKLLEVFGDDGPRMSYLDGMVELMAPDLLHEYSKYVLGRMVSDLIVGLRIPANGYGSSTFKKRDAERGLEPDECFYLTNRQAVWGMKKGDLDVIPPPDLVIEVEISSSLLDKLDIYAGLGFPEVWRYDGANLIVLLLRADGTYAPSAQSRAFPFLPLDEFARQLANYDPEIETEWTIAYREWVRVVVAPLSQA